MPKLVAAAIKFKPKGCEYFQIMCGKRHCDVLEMMYNLRIEYLPVLDEARFIYTIPSSLFDQGEAMKVIRERALKFRGERSYFNHVYLRKDLTKYDNEKNLAIYTSFIKFEK